MVGSGFRTKGVDRAIEGLAKLQSTEGNEAQLVVVGHGKPDSYQHLARSLGVGDRVHMLGGRADVPEWMLAADLLVHPARNENTGTVLLEALANGLPLLVKRRLRVCLSHRAGQCRSARAVAVFPDSIQPTAAGDG